MLVMNNCFFTFRSITTAQRGAQVLDRAGILNQLSRTPKSFSVRGCGYCLKVRENNCKIAAQALVRAGINPSALYRICANGTVEVWRN